MKQFYSRKCRKLFRKSPLLCSGSSYWLFALDGLNKSSYRGDFLKHGVEYYIQLEHRGVIYFILD